MVLSSIKILGLYGLVPHKVINPFLKGHPDIANMYFEQMYLKSLILYPTILHFFMLGFKLSLDFWEKCKVIHPKYSEN